jgi:hypothetical protein
MNETEKELLLTIATFIDQAEQILGKQRLIKGITPGFPNVRVQELIKTIENQKTKEVKK